ncbi:SMI1/KNR4 family protein [Pseudomonas putida]|uniref:SMI1/KNR4 family protein n=1 Tax=Pseudomonas putida TaxID=303 RepID=UPI0039064FCD
MHTIKHILEKFSNDPRIDVFPPDAPLPTLTNSLSYPPDLAEFYRLCGGAQLSPLKYDSISFTILPPQQIKQSNTEIVGNPCDDDISSSWYLICKTDNNDYISIDLSIERSGRCYDSNFEVHGVAGSCPTIALSFKELLVSIYTSDGDAIFWRNKNYGDAYD